MWRPMLSVDEILDRIDVIYQYDGNTDAAETIHRIVKFAASLGDARKFRYLEVGEEGNPRNSFDINFYAAGLRLNDIRPYIEMKSRAFSISDEQIARLYRLDGHKPFGHLSGGISRDGADFLTVYYG